jgi:hypothetical protein
MVPARHDIAPDPPFRSMLRSADQRIIRRCLIMNL